MTDENPDKQSAHVWKGQQIPELKAFWTHAHEMGHFIYAGEAVDRLSKAETK